MAIGDLGATDIFSPGDNWNCQSSSTNTNQTITEVLKANGDIACLTPFQNVVTASAEYEACGTATVGVDIGDEVGGYLVTSINLTHAAGEAPTLSIEGVSFPSATQTANSATTGTDVDITDVSGLIGGSGEPTEINYSWEAQVTQSLGSDGEIAYAVSRTPKLTYTESGLGTLTSAPTITGYTLESYENSDSNQETDTYTATFVKELATA